MKDVYEKREEIREQIEYDLICTPVNRTQVDEFVELMLEVAMTRSPTIKIGRDAEYPTAFVQQRFEQITSSPYREGSGRHQREQHPRLERQGLSAGRPVQCPQFHG